MSTRFLLVLAWFCAIRATTSVVTRRWRTALGGGGAPAAPGRWACQAATVRRDLRPDGGRPGYDTHGGAVAHGVMYELPLRYRAGRREQEKRRIAAKAASRVSRDGCRGRAHGRHDDHGGGARARRPRAADDRHQRAEHRDRARRPPCGRSSSSPAAWCANAHTSCAVRWPRRRSRASTSTSSCIGVDGIEVDAGCTTHHEVEAHTIRCSSTRAAGHRRDRLLQDRPGGLRPHLRPRRGRRGDHRRHRPRARPDRRCPPPPRAWRGGALVEAGTRR